MSVNQRIERLEQAIGTEKSSGLSRETFRKVVRVIQDDELAVDLLRQAALVQDSARWWTSPDSSQEFYDIIDRLGIKELAVTDRPEAAKRLRIEAENRMRLLLATEFGNEMAEKIFPQIESQNAAHE